MLTADGKKRCPRCGDTKLAEGNFYHVSRKDGDGFSGYCVACTKEKVRVWQKENPEALRAYQREQYAKKPKKPPRPRKWADPRDGLRAASKRFHQKPEFKMEHKQREHLRRATLTRTFTDRNGNIEEMRLSGLFTLDEWEAVVTVFGGRCAYCGREEKLEIEHMTPLSRGGKHEIGNIVPACKPCNSSKRSKTAEEFAQVLGFDPQELRGKALLN